MAKNCGFIPWNLLLKKGQPFWIFFWWVWAPNRLHLEKRAIVCGTRGPSTVNIRLIWAFLVRFSNYGSKTRIILASYYCKNVTTPGFTFAVQIPYSFGIPVVTVFIDTREIPTWSKICLQKILSSLNSFFIDSSSFMCVEPSSSIWNFKMKKLFARHQ